MTNYSERLDKIIRAVYNRGYVDGEPLAMYDKPIQMKQSEAKQAITSLYKELVAAAKPKYRKPSYGNGVDESLALSYSDKEYNLALDEFEQNLLKELEEV